MLLIPSKLIKIGKLFKMKLFQKLNWVVLFSPGIGKVRIISAKFIIGPYQMCCYHHVYTQFTNETVS